MLPHTRSILSICALVALGLALAYFTNSQNKNGATNTNSYNFANVVTGLDGTDARLVSRIENPYPTAPEPPERLDAQIRAALVNILCQTSSGTIRPISGSGIVIDPRGVILTNAHIAQYVLLSEDRVGGLSCVVRTGSPARAAWKAVVLYIPPVWVNAHTKEINVLNAVSTGEHDYALLAVTGTSDGAPLPSDGLSFMSIDTRDRIGFTGDQVLSASYPAEFAGASAIGNSLHAAILQTSISELLTFETGSVDLLSVDSVVQAEGGSSGGAVVNAWGYIFGLIVTISETTTADRDLHALTISYIDRDLQAQTGKNLATFLSGDITETLSDFNTTSLHPLLQQYANFLN